MSSEEKRQILKMVEDGKISADEAMSLIKALEVEQAEPETYSLHPTSFSEVVNAPEFEDVKARARRFAQIPLWVGVGTTVLFAWLMYTSYENSGFGFWFYCLTFPFLFGVMLTALMAGGIHSRWLFVDVHQRPGQSPARITLGFPVPFGLVAWGVRIFGMNIPGMSSDQAANVGELVKHMGTMNSPIIVNAQDSGDGERVMVYIG